MPATIGAEEQQLLHVFSDKYLFEIPPYQRPYAWTTQETEELLDDLLYAIDNDRPIEEVPPYFLGSVVLIKETTGTRAEIVDGQQRITTLTIMLCVLRELTTDEDARLSLDGYVRQRGDSIAGTQDQFRLRLRSRDSQFFQNNVQSSGRLKDFLKDTTANRTDSQQRIFENATYLWKSLSQLGEGKCTRLAQFVIQRCYLVVVSASDQDSAYRIFSVMNDRGLDLSPTDILKADIIGSMDDRIRDSYTDKWEKIEEHLGRENFRDLFAHMRMIYMKTKLRGTLQDEFQRSVLISTSGAGFVDDVLDPMAREYEDVTSASFPDSGDAIRTNDYLTYLNRLDNFDWVPPAMWYSHHYRNEGSKLVRFMRDLERLAYGLFIMRANVNERINRYADLLRWIDRSDDLNSEGSPLQLRDAEKKEILNVLNGPIYALLRVRRQVLLRLDTLLADAGATYEHRVITVEHVLPQNPSPCSEWARKFQDESVREKWTHRLANLVLLSRQKNSRAQNYDFTRKKDEYFSKVGVAPFALTTDVQREVEWTPEILEERQHRLIGLLQEEWRLT